MTTRAVDLSPRQAARVAGIAILAIAILAFFANFFVLNALIVSGDAATTAANIMASEGLFRIGIASLLVVVVLDMVAAWALYIFFKPVNPSLALLTAWFRVVYAAIFGVALLNLLLALELVGGEGYLTVAGSSDWSCLACTWPGSGTWCSRPAPFPGCWAPCSSRQRWAT
jgi:hypothetical protein